jgi:cysteine desulfurase
LESEGYRISYLPVDRDGLLNLADLGSAITDDTAVVSLMWANNETGVVFPIKDVAEICYARGILYHCDAVQATGKVDVNVRNLPINYLSLTGHKAHAPKGIGAERNLRGGTESVPLIVGLGKAAELAHDRLPEYDQKVRPLRDSLEEEILERLPNSELNGHAIQRLANTTNIPFHGIESDALLILLDKEGICASSGSACLADSDEPSHVIKAMKPECNGSREMIRFSFDWSNTPAEVETAVAAVKRSAEFLRI